MKKNQMKSEVKEQITRIDREIGKKKENTVGSVCVAECEDGKFQNGGTNL